MFSKPETGWMRPYILHEIQWILQFSFRIGISDQNNEINPSISIDNNDYINVVWNEGGYQNEECWHSASTFFTTSWQPINSFECYAGWPSIASDNQGNLHYGSTVRTLITPQ